MIESSKFILCHVGKTGGDAIKQICLKLNLPDLNIASTEDPSKHSPVEPAGKDFLMSIRRLPARALSYYFHLYYQVEGEENQELRAQLNLDHPEEAAGWILENDNSEEELTIHTNNGRNVPRSFIRTEKLREDLKVVLTHYYELNPEQKTLIQTANTKPKNPYNHELFTHFTIKQLKELYKRSPLWCEMERAAYGNLLIDL